MLWGVIKVISLVDHTTRLVLKVSFLHVLLICICYLVTIQRKFSDLLFKSLQPLKEHLKIFHFTSYEEFSGYACVRIYHVSWSQHSLAFLHGCRLSVPGPSV